MAIPEWTAAMGMLDDPYAPYDDSFFYYAPIPGSTPPQVVMATEPSVQASLEIERDKEGNPTGRLLPFDRFRLLTGEDAELEAQIRRDTARWTSQGDELFRYEGAVILRHQKYTDRCSDSDATQTNRQFPMSPEAVRAVAYFSRKYADQSWCLLPAEPGAESTLPQVFTPWDLSNQAQLAEFEAAVKKILEAQGGGEVDSFLNPERATLLAPAVTTKEGKILKEELERILREIQEKQRANESAVDRFFSQPWYKRWLDIGEAAVVFSVIGWGLHRLLERIFPPRPPSPPTSPIAQPRPIPAPEEIPVSAPEGTSEMVPEASTAWALGAMTAGFLAVLILRRGGVRKTKVREGANRYVEIRFRPSSFKPLFEPLRPAPVRAPAGGGVRAFEAAFGTP